MTPLRRRAHVLVEARYEHRILGLMLLCLHLAIWMDFGGALSRSLMLAHLGLFLIWQPVWRREEALNAVGGLLFVAVTLLFVWFLDPILITGWVVLLTGLLGGRVTVGRSDRYAYLLAMVFVVSELLVGCIPRMVDIVPLQREAQVLFTYGFSAVPIGLMLIPGQPAAGRNEQSLDFLYALTSALLACVLAMGSLLAMFLGGTEYPAAVVQTMLGIAVFLLAISWLWSPLAGFSGLGSIWERHVQTVGTPFEQWLGDLEELSSRDESAESLVQAALDRLCELPWVAGAHWATDAASGNVGTATTHEVRVHVHDIVLKLFARRRLGAVLYLHSSLLLKVIGHYYNARQRELELARDAHLQAVHETGARVTHDIKNLLQSLQTVNAAVQQRGEQDPIAVGKLLERQLPHITQRLQLALDKLQTPHDEMVHEGDLKRWWDVLRMRNQSESIVFHEKIQSSSAIPVELFDSVVENLLENARAKRQLDPGIEIEVELRADPDHVSLTVADSGAAVPDAVARRLFRTPLESRNGLGIGLYQAARHAERLGYELRLAPSAERAARFELRRSPASVPPREAP